MTKQFFLLIMKINVNVHIRKEEIKPSKEETMHKKKEMTNKILKRSKYKVVLCKFV